MSPSRTGAQFHQSTFYAAAGDAGELLAACKVFDAGVLATFGLTGRWKARAESFTRHSGRTTWELP